ncbi:basic proline-rich protein-like [Lynx canadensis]|uniref:basic proline-rich protein-like n=1 Tax=Lynx canadensis TaxID=61383 RepID=UPI0011B009E2|nr:basic proline-rich protein-like [Lynx canadensis]
MKTAGGGRSSRPKALPRAAALGARRQAATLAALALLGACGPAPPPASARPGQAPHTPAAGALRTAGGARRRLHRRLHRRRRRRFGGAGRGGRGGGMDPFPGAKTRSPRERRCQRVTSGGGACAIYGSGRPSPRPSPPPPPPRSLTDCLTAPRAGPSPASPASPAATERHRAPPPPPPPAALRGSSRPPAAREVPPDLPGASLSKSRADAAGARVLPSVPPGPGERAARSFPTWFRGIGRATGHGQRVGPAAELLPELPGARRAPRGRAGRGLTFVGNPAGRDGDADRSGPRAQRDLHGWPLRRRRLSAAASSSSEGRAGRYDPAASAPRPSPATLLALQCPVARPPRASKPLRSRGLHCCVVQGQESERRAGARLKSHPETWAKSGSQGAKPGAGNKARAVSAAPTPSLARNVRPKCPVPRETADAPRNSLDPLPGNPRALQVPRLGRAAGERGRGLRGGHQACRSQAGVSRGEPLRSHERPGPTDPRPPPNAAQAGPRPALTSPRSGQEGRRRTPTPGPGPPEPERPPRQRSPAARTLPGRGAKVHCEARPAAPPEVPGSRVPNPAARPRRSPARAPAGQGNAPPRRVARPAPLRPAPGPRRAKFNFRGRRPLGAAGRGGEPPTRPRADPARLPAPLIRRASRGALAARWRRRQRPAGRVCGPAPSHVPTSHPPGRAHGPGRERASAHAPRCLPPREAAARRAGAGRWREEVPAGGPAARPRRRAPRPPPLRRDLRSVPGAGRGAPTGRPSASAGAPLLPPGPKGFGDP